MNNKYVLVAVSFLFWIGCGPENIVEIEIDEETEVQVPHHPLAASGDARVDAVAINCVEIAYPFMMQVDGAITLINNQDEYITAQTDYTSGIDFEYPIQTSSDVVITGAFDLADRYADCLPTKGWSSGELPYFDIDNTTSCLALTLPLTLRSTAGVTTYNNHEDIIIALTEGEHFFDFPIELENVDGQRGLLHTTDELFTALNACHSVVSPDLSDIYQYRPTACYDIVYPQGFLDADNVVHSVETMDQYCTGSIKGDLVAWTYPVSLTDDHMRAASVTDDANWALIKDACKDGLDGDHIHQLLKKSADYDPLYGCHTLIYPIVLSKADGELHYLYSPADVQSVVENWPLDVPFINYTYPLNVVHNADEVILLNYNDLLHYIVKCP